MFLGNCSYQRAFPAKYHEVWNRYKSVFYENREKEEREEAKPVQPKKTEMEPLAIVMSEEKQKLLEKTLLDLYPERQVPLEDEGNMPKDMIPFFRRLVREGFPKERVEQAIHKVLAKSMSRRNDAILDWLCFYLDDDELPLSYSKSDTSDVFEPNFCFQGPKRTKST